MKKIILTVALVVGCLTFANAQENALGLKWGSGWYGVAIDLSYQRFLNESNRLELNLGTDGFDILSVSALYQWVWNLTGGFNWYAGVGASIDVGFGLRPFLLGNIGIEYNFNSPLQLAIDYTPSMFLIPAFGHILYDETRIRLAARWRF